MMRKIQREYSVPAREQDHLAYIREKLKSSVTKEHGFIMDVKKVTVSRAAISSITGNYIYRIDADVDSFVPESKMELDAVVEISRGEAHIAIARGCLKVIFHSPAALEPGAAVTIVLKNVKYQCGTYRATAELK